MDLCLGLEVAHSKEKKDLAFSVKGVGVVAEHLKNLV